MGRKEQEYPIVGFNVIEEILSQHSENPQAASTIIQQLFPTVHHTQVGALVNLIQSRSQNASTSAVKVGKIDVMLPKGEPTKVKSQVHFGPVPEGMPMIFEPNEIIELPEGLELGEEITKTTPETSSHLTILVCNNTDRNILLKRRTELGQVHMVKSVLPIPNPPEQKYTQGEENKWFTVLDQRKAHHQGFMAEESRPLTAFVTPWGLYQWNRIPFGQ